MSDRMATTIDFGPVTKAQADYLMDGGGRLLPASNLTAVRAELIETSPEEVSWDPATGLVTVYDPEATWGSSQFEELRNLLRLAGIGYTLRQEPKYEYPGELIEWRPGMEAEHSTACDADGNAYVLGHELREWLDKIDPPSVATSAEMWAWLDETLGWSIPLLVSEKEVPV